MSKTTYINIFMLAINKKLGYYKVDDLDFDSKILACIHATKFDKQVQWVFNNDVFDNYAWHIEPIESLDTLYDRRSKKLRELYDYIIVSYSGGADSHNIVESFLRQGLHIDEIIVNTMEKGSNSFTTIDSNVKNPENAASEHYLQTIPRLKEISNRSPKTKITVLDLTDYLFKDWIPTNDASWVTGRREGLNPLNVTRFNYLHFKDVRSKLDKDKTVAIIVGVEKPRTFIHSANNNFYLRFTDRAANIVSVNDYIKDYTNSTVEYFYWSPDATDIICKQAHVIKRWLEHHPHYRNFWYGKTLTKEVFRLIHERLLRTILYSTWNDSWFQSDKATKDWYSEFDAWFIQGHIGSSIHTLWLEGIKYVKENASKFVNKDQGIEDGLTVFSHDYKIGPMTPINRN